LLEQIFLYLVQSLSTLHLFSQQFEGWDIKEGCKFDIKIFIFCDRSFCFMKRGFPFKSDQIDFIFDEVVPFLNFSKSKTFLMNLAWAKSCWICHANVCECHVTSQPKRQSSTFRFNVSSGTWFFWCLKAYMIDIHCKFDYKVRNWQGNQAECSREHCSKCLGWGFGWKFS